MLALDAYRPDQWHDFFVMVGGGAAVLLGLVFSLAVYVHGYVQAARRGSVAWLLGRRIVALAVLYAGQLVGAALLVADHVTGLYVAAVAMVGALAFMISGAWLLVVGTTMREPNALDRSP